MSVISDVIKSFDQSSELGQVQREVVEALAALGQSKAETFNLEIQESLFSAGNGTNLTIPISAILRSLIDVRAYSSTESGNIGKVVTDTLKQFLRGTQEDILGGVGSLISETLSVFLGKSSASTGTVEEYYVVTEGLSIIRVDIKSWYLNVSSSSIQTKMEKVTALVAVKSIVDLEKIDFGTFLNLYQQMLLETKMTSEEIKQALDTAKKIYNDFKSISSINQTREALQEFVHTPPGARNLERISYKHQILDSDTGVKGVAVFRETGHCVVRLQNSTTGNLTRESFQGENVVYNQDPPAQINANNSSNNFQVSYNFDDSEQASFTMQYKMPNESVPFTASVLIEKINGQISVSPSGASPGRHNLSFNVLGQQSPFQILFTFN